MGMYVLLFTLHSCVDNYIEKVIGKSTDPHLNSSNIAIYIIQGHQGMVILS